MKKLKNFVSLKKSQYAPRSSWFFIIYIFILFIVFIILLALIGWPLLRELAYFPARLDNLRTKDDIPVGTYAAFFGTLTAIGALIGYAFSFLRTINNERQTIAIQQGQITDRINKAVENLGAQRADGSHNFEMRVGAIYALERTLQDSRSDHQQILEILTAYIRNNAPRLDNDDQGVAANRIDIQTTITVIGRNPLKLGKGNFAVDLRETDLRGLDFSNGDFANAMFGGADLYWAIMRGIKLQHAFLDLARLEKADLSMGQLQGASMKGVNVKKR